MTLTDHLKKQVYNVLANLGARAFKWYHDSTCTDATPTPTPYPKELHTCSYCMATVS